MKNLRLKSHILLKQKKYLLKNPKKLFFKKILKRNFSRKILFSSVVPNAYRLIRKLLTKEKFKVIEIKDLNIKKLLPIKVQNYRQLGSDRISNAVGSLHYKNCLIVDFGTATTFDILNNYMYVGGVISPGVTSSISNLSKSTALLPLVSLKKNFNSFGKNTQEALNAGFIWGYEGLINNVIKRIKKKTKVKYKIILTGGYAKLFKSFIKEKSIIDQNITIKGIAKIFKESI